MSQEDFFFFKKEKKLGGERLTTLDILEYKPSFNWNKPNWCRQYFIPKHTQKKTQLSMSKYKKQNPKQLAPRHFQKKAEAPETLLLRGWGNKVQEVAAGWENRAIFNPLINPSINCFAVVVGG